MLKKKWLALGMRDINDANAWNDEAWQAGIDELAKESALLLLASQEAVDLMVFLEGHGLFAYSVRDKVEELFASPLAADARRTLIDLPDKRSGPQGLENYREAWSGAAGKGCPEAEFEAFHAALGGGACAQEALFGFYQRPLALEKPLETLRTVLDVWEKNLHSRGRNGAITGITSNLLDSAPFREIEQILPEKPFDRPPSEANFAKLDQETLDSARMHLFTKWAMADRQAAFDYLMANSDRLNPLLILPVADAFTKENTWKGFEWIQQLPEGPHFDIAAKGVVNTLRIMYPEQARQVADQIGDPVAREEAYKRIKAPYEESQTEGN
jgi:hypothetical protein